MAKPRALIAEDSFLVLLRLEAVLKDYGIEIIGTAATVDEAMALATSTDPDVAILDVNLDDRMIFPAADLLIDRGVPVIFTTGYSPQETLPVRYTSTPTLQKPYPVQALLTLLDSVLAAERPVADTP